MNTSKPARPKRTFGVKTQNNDNKYEQEKLINANTSIQNEIEYNKRNTTSTPENNFISFENLYENSNFEFYACPICNEEIFGLYQLNIHLDTVHTENQSGNVILSLFKKTQKITEEITGTSKCIFLFYIFFYTTFKINIIIIIIIIIYYNINEIYIFFFKLFF